MAKWIKNPEITCGKLMRWRASVTEIQCSKCKHWALQWAEVLPYDFCPHCGTEMKGGLEWYEHRK